MHTLADTGEIAIMIPFVAMGCGLLIVLISIVVGAIKAMSQKRQFEESRREIAAYVAEGSISAKDARDMLDAGRTA